MVFRRFNRNIRPVHRIKHVVDSQAAASAGATAFTTLVKSVDAPVLANTSEVETGATVNGIFLIVEVNAVTAAALPNCYLMVAKNPGSNLTFPAPNVVGSSDNKKYVIHQEMLMLQQQALSNPRTLFKGVIAIPKHLRRMSIDDELFIAVLAPGVDIQFCVQCHYKEFR